MKRLLLALLAFVSVSAQAQWPAWINRSTTGSAGGSGTVTSIIVGSGLTATVSPITVSGTISLTSPMTNVTYDTAGSGNVFKINGNSFSNTNCDASHFVRGDGTCQTVSASAALSGITAATATNTIASGNNTGQFWGWSNTTDATTAFTIGETAAATNGTANNQSALDISTLGSSTAVPLRIIQATPTSTIPSALFSSAAGSATLSPALAMRFSRGTMASPTVITTGDRLGYVSGQGFVGATNKFLEATRIESDSTGTITDATSGIGGILKFYTTLQGTDTTVQEGMRIFGGSTPQIGAPNGVANNPSYSFTAHTGYGITYDTTRNCAAIIGNQLTIACGATPGGNPQFEVAAGSTTIAGLTDLTTKTSGLAWGTSNTTDVSVIIGSTETMKVDANGHLNFLKGPQSAAPTIAAACTTAGGFIVSGNDSIFTYNTGTTATATTCTITFNKTFTNPAHCFVNEITNQATTTTASATTAAVVLTTSTAWTTGAKIDVLCFGHL